MVSGPQFQRIMEECPSGLMDEICQPYLDDNLIYSKTFEDHIKDIRSLALVQKQQRQVNAKKV